MKTFEVDVKGRDTRQRKHPEKVMDVEECETGQGMDIFTLTVKRIMKNMDEALLFRVFNDGMILYSV